MGRRDDQESDAAGVVILILLVVAALALPSILDGVNLVSLEYDTVADCNFVWSEGESGIWARTQSCEAGEVTLGG